MNAFNLGDYVDVPARVKMLFERWPNARIVESLPQIRMFDGREWIEVTVTIHLGDDTTPVVASAWECKGTTSFTRDSEMMNCSTSALGRALGMMIPFGKMASFEEVQNRQDEQPAAARAPKIIVDMPNKEVWPVSKKQLQELSELGYGGAVPANWNEAKAIIARMQVK
jgi:hypothetical protein